MALLNIFSEEAEKGTPLFVEKTFLIGKLE